MIQVLTNCFCAKNNTLFVDIHQRIDDAITEAFHHHGIEDWVQGGALSHVVGHLQNKDAIGTPGLRLPKSEHWNVQSAKRRSLESFLKANKVQNYSTVVEKR